MWAMDVVHFLGTPGMLQRLCQKKPISLVTAQWWLKQHGYQYIKEPEGQFVDGHERKDVREYRDGVFLPAFEKLEERTRKWVKDNNGGINVEVDPGGQKMVVWFHDESTFYANDQCRLHWVHKSETVVPHAKGEGASLMVTDFMSADYG